MKTIVISGFFMLLGLIVLAQPTGSGKLQLAVRGGSQDRTLAFRPGKRIKLTTTTGEIIYSRQYLVYGNEILTENNMLIGFDDLVRISGRVMNDTGRLAAGVLLAATGVILAGSTIAIASLVLTPGSLLLYLAIEAGIIVGGVRTMRQNRTFTLDKGWEIQTYLSSFFSLDFSKNTTPSPE